jgi:hypothetical protein
MIQDGETRMEKEFGWFDLCHSSVAIQIDDRCLCWRVHREPRWCTAGNDYQLQCDWMTSWNQIMAHEVLVFE